VTRHKHNKKFKKENFKMKRLVLFIVALVFVFSTTVMAASEAEKREKAAVKAENAEMKADAKLDKAEVKANAKLEKAEAEAKLKKLKPEQKAEIKRIKAEQKAEQKRDSKQKKKQQLKSKTHTNLLDSKLMCLKRH